MILEHYLRKVYAAQQVAELCDYQIQQDESPESVLQNCIQSAPEELQDKIQEIGKLMESESEEISDEELEKIVAELSDEDILEVYDEDELEVVDEETNEILECDLPEELNEILSRQERMKARIRFARTKSKRQIKARIALKRHSDRATLNKRARRLAIKALKAKFAKKKLGDMSVSDKERVEKMLKSRKALINRLALKLVPRVKKLEKERLS